MSIRVLDPGALTTVQDLGRPGLGSFGVPVSGAMDPWALRAANLLVGNDEGAAGLEVTLNGPTLAFEHDAVVAVAGGRLEGAPAGAAFRARAGDELALGKVHGSARSWIAFRGGIAVPETLGSRSTQIVAALGGLDGRALRAGDVLPLGEPSGDPPLRRLAPGALRETAPLRAIRGPQEEAFSPRALTRFWSWPYRVSARADRTGVRLEGPSVAPDGGADLLPEGVVPGAVQVPGDGGPIVLGPDGPATGGYVKIAVVIAADAGAFGHVRPGDTLRFEETTVEQARAAYREREQRLRERIEDA